MTNKWRQAAIFGCIIFMMVSLFFSRAALSVSMILFVVLSFFQAGIRLQLRNFFASPLLWGMSLLFLLALISGLWAEDKKAWAEILQIKLPLFFLPLAFAAPIGLSKKNWEWLAYVFIGLVSAGTLWSMFYYLTNLSVVHEEYLRSKSIITPLGNDHVRFSWLVAVAILLAGWLWVTGNSRKFFNWFLPMVMLWLIIFLHILAARTGLFSFYMIVLLTGVWLIIKKTKLGWAIALIAGVILLPVAANFLLPTFQNRVKYFLHDVNYFKEAHYLQGSNDAVRVISIKAGWEILNEHPVKGVGFGDVYPATVAWYGKHYPEMLETDMIFPSSEWMIYGAACGWPGVLLFTAIMLIPFFIRIKNRELWWLLNSTIAFSFLFDIGLEVQFGVFVYAFIVLWWWKWLNAEKM